MPSFSDVRTSVVMAVLMTATLLLTAAVGRADGQADRPDRDEITRALEKVKADPNLATEQTIRMLAWKNRQDVSPFGMPEWFKWLVGLFRWFDQSARVLIWVVVAMLAVALVAYLVRLVRAHRLPGRERAFVAPTHVRDLDIRPETLPADIGASSRALWDRGEHRAALALLYRGLLSRLAHVHHVPIRDSSTEGDCLALAESRLPAARCEYASRLVRVWQRVVYGREDVHAATVHRLCDDFAAALDVTPSLDAAGGARAS